MVKWTAGALALCLIHSMVEIISSVIIALLTTTKGMDVKALPSFVDETFHIQRRQKP